MAALVAMAADSAIAVVSSRGAARIRAGHPWVFRPDVVRGPERDAGDGGPSLVSVEDGRGKRLGLATWAARARLALRMLARQGEPERRSLVEIVDERLAAALKLRLGMKLDRDAYRVAHAESDGLPGLVVDRYADAAVIQTMSVAMNAARAEIAEIVRARLGARVVVARDDGSTRDFEGLPRFAGLLHGQDARIVYRLGENRLEADLLVDGKTGGFLDQADNQAALAALAPAGGRVLDAFTYHGGFALALARKVGAGGEVVAVDESEPAVARANSFDLLRALEARGERFDVVVIDPPALAKRGGDAALATAARAYKELVLRGARLTRPGGLLCACSCSGRVNRAHWEEICTDALADAGRAAHLLSRAGAGRDHPELAGVPETGHLKAWTYRIL